MINIDAAIYSALEEFNATNTLGDNAQTPYVVFSILKDNFYTRDAIVYRQDVQLTIDVVTDTYDEGDTIAAQVASKIQSLGVSISRYGTEDSVIEEKYIKTLDYTLINI